MYIFVLIKKITMRKENGNFKKFVEKIESKF